MNTRLLRRVEKHIAAEPRRYDQDATLRTNVVDEMSAPPCGTVGCIAGWTCVLTGKTKRARSTFGYTRARKQLGLTPKQAHRLFAYSWDTRGWPIEFRNAYSDAVTQKEKAKAAVARIEHFIKTKGKE